MLSWSVFSRALWIRVSTSRTTSVWATASSLPPTTFRCAYFVSAASYLLFIDYLHVHLQNQEGTLPILDAVSEGQRAVHCRSPHKPSGGRRVGRRHLRGLDIGSSGEYVRFRGRRQVVRVLPACVRGSAHGSDAGVGHGARCRIPVSLVHGVW